MGFSRQESWSGLPFPTLGDLPDPGIEPPSPVSPALTAGFFFFFLPLSHPGSSRNKQGYPKGKKKYLEKIFCPRTTIQSIKQEAVITHWMAEMFAEAQGYPGGVLVEEAVHREVPCWQLYLGNHCLGC